MAEKNRKVGPFLDVTEHQQRDEHHPGDHEQREQARLFARLREVRRKREEKKKKKKDDASCGNQKDLERVETGS